MKTFLLIPISLLFLCSCTASENTGSNQNSLSEVEIVDPSFYQEKFLRGIKFFARGNEPFWTLDIYSHDKIIFSELNEIEIKATNVKLSPGKNLHETIFTADTENGELIVSILKDSCQDNMSGEMFEYNVSVSIKNSSSAEKVFNGCGRYLFDYRLNDIWVMEEMIDVVLDKERLMKGLPMFEFNLREKRVSGHAGCNQFFGGIELKGNMISFGNLAATKMACPDMTVEQKIFQALSQKNFTYKIVKLKLVLESDSGLRMVFRKVD
ncbi:META domain-containing protein [Ignavibacterium sp.]|uniref:META domain-containing protein n=1 Tax=Ignavibacterium sp. TaxID=2651167 RepID=UPI00307DCD78